MFRSFGIRQDPGNGMPRDDVPYKTYPCRAFFGFVEGGHLESSQGLLSIHQHSNPSWGKTNSMHDGCKANLGRTSIHLVRNRLDAPKAMGKSDPTLERIFPDIPEDAVGPLAEAYYNHRNRCQKCNETGPAKEPDPIFF
jgi:hypothetical protein